LEPSHPLRLPGVFLAIAMPRLWIRQAKCRSVATERVHRAVTAGATYAPAQSPARLARPPSRRTWPGNRRPAADLRRGSTRGMKAAPPARRLASSDPRWFVSGDWPASGEDSAVAARERAACPERTCRVRCEIFRLGEGSRHARRPSCSPAFAAAVADFLR
jgi:hypothetical protein